MIILVINAGSSSVKFTCFNNENVLASGLVERIQPDDYLLQHEETKASLQTFKYKNHKGSDLKIELSVKDSKEAVKLIAKYLTDEKVGHNVLNSLADVKVIAHRIVHGGEKLTKPAIVDNNVKTTIKECFTLAPLHNPPNLKAIEACEEVFPGIVNVANFDTAFHSTMPPHAYLYGLPLKYYTEDKIRRYGFHGMSHSYVSKAAAKFVNKPLEDLKIITAHLGNGCSMSAIDGGKCIDTSMGLTPLEGLIMGTRCGDMDPAIVYTIMQVEKRDRKFMGAMLNNKSGMLGLANIGSSDLRDIEDAYMKGNKDCETALRTYSYRIKKYLGSYTAALNGLDILVFTGGVGENSEIVRGMVCENMDIFGIKLNKEVNDVRSSIPRVISMPDSKITVLVIPTNEELEMAQQTLELINNK